LNQNFHDFIIEWQLFIKNIILLLATLRTFTAVPSDFLLGHNALLTKGMAALWEHHSLSVEMVELLLAVITLYYGFHVI
jgi:hypothetical protein